MTDDEKRKFEGLLKYYQERVKRAVDDLVSFLLEELNKERMRTNKATGGCNEKSTDDTLSH